MMDTMESVVRMAITLGWAAALIGAQDSVDPYSIGITVTGSQNCPVFIGRVAPGSPAERAGLRGGDRLVGVDGAAVETFEQAARLLRSDRPADVAVKLSRDGKEFVVAVAREKRSDIVARDGEKIVSGAIVPLDTTDAEVEHMLHFDGQRFIGRVFPTHYPANPELYYPGFEIFLLRDPDQIAVGGIEKGPASHAGVHWGDVILSVNRVPTQGKTRSELEGLFSSSRSEPMRIEIDRLGTVRTFNFDLEKASDVARQNGWRIDNGRLLPLFLSDQDSHCFPK